MNDGSALYAILRRYPCDPRTRADAGLALAEVRALHASQPGYAGSIAIDDGRCFIALNLWDTEQAAAAEREAIGEQVPRLLAPLSKPIGGRPK